MMSFRAMFKMKLINVILLFLILITVEVDATVSVLSRSEKTHPEWQFGYRITGITSFDGGRFLYTLCDNNTDRKTCTIHQEDLLSGAMLYSCNVTLIPEQKNARPGKYFARSFGEDKAIFVWEEKGEQTFVKFITTKLTNCQSNEAKLLDSSKMQMIEPIAYQLYTSLKIAVYEDYYDVFYKDVKRCGNRECKISIDADGNVISAPSSTLVSTTRYQMVIVMQPIAKRAVAKGFLCVKFDWNHVYISIVQSDGKEKPLARLDDNNQKTGLLVDHEIIGICTLSERELKITCSQYDRDGNVKMETNLTNITPDTNMITAHILHRGGFLLMFYRMEKCKHSDECWAVSSVWIVKINERGEIIGHYKFKGFGLTSMIQRIAFIYENPKGEGHCASLVYSEYDSIRGKNRANNRHVITNCFAEDDFED